MVRGLAWLVAMVMLTGCGSTASQSPVGPAPTAEPTTAAAEPTTTAAAPTADEPAAGPSVGDDLERLLEALPTDNQLHGYRGNGTCRTEDDECDWPYLFGKYLSGTAERGVPLGVSVEPFGGSRDQAIAISVGPCPNGPYWVPWTESRGRMLGNPYSISGEQTFTSLAYGDFKGLACDRHATYVLPPEVPDQALKQFGGEHESHLAVLSNGSYAVAFSAPDHELLISMVAEYFKRAGLARVA